MENYIMIYPMFGMFALILIVLTSLWRARVKSVQQGVIRLSHYLTYSTKQKEPERNIAIARNFSNLFEAPVLFFVVCLAIMIADVENMLFLALAWGYVIMRGIHSFIHTGSNNLRGRMVAYMMSWVFLTALWLGLVISTLGSAQ